MAVQKVASGTLLVNDETVGWSPNTLEFDEGLGEQSVEAAIVGSGLAEQIIIEDLESNFGMVNFSIPVTVENIALARKWKKNPGRNLIQILSQTSTGSLTKTFQQATLTNAYTVPISTDGKIDLEFKTNQAI